MTNPDYRALCAELLADYEQCRYRSELHDRARALLDQPESIEDRIAKADAAIEASMERIRKIAATPARDLDHTQSPADREVAELVEWLQSMRDLAGEHNPDEQRRYTRAAELLGRPTPQPVAVSERLLGDELCWWFEPDEDDGYGGMWTLLRIRGGTTRYTHWLPSSALPTPEATND